MSAPTRRNVSPHHANIGRLVPTIGTAPFDVALSRAYKGGIIAPGINLSLDPGQRGRSCADRVEAPEEETASSPDDRPQMRRHLLGLCGETRGGSSGETRLGAPVGGRDRRPRGLFDRHRRVRRDRAELTIGVDCYTQARQRDGARRELRSAARRAGESA